MKTILYLLLLVPGLALAAPKKSKHKAPPAAVEEKEPIEIKTSFGANLDAQGQYFPDSLAPSVGQTFGILNAELSGSVKVGKNFLVKARPTGHLDPNNPSSSEKSWADLPEGYAQTKLSLSESTTLITQVGFNTFTWGVTDGFNPLDVVSARRYSDPLRSEKLGAFSLTNKLDFGFLLLEAIYIPWQRKSQLPAENSRWLPREIGGDIVDQGTIFHPPKEPAYSFRKDFEFDSALRNNWGARLSSHFLGMDLAAYVFDGAASVPAVSYDLSGDLIRFDPVTFFPLEINSRSAIPLHAIYNRVIMTGASAVFPIWEFIVRTEFAVTKSYRKNSTKILERNAEAAVELEHTFNFEKATLTAIGLFSWADPQENGSQTSSTPSFTRLFDRAVGAGMRWQPTETWYSELFAAFDVKHGGQLFKLENTYKLNDIWKVYGGGEMLEGKTATPIGVYRKNDRVYAGLKVSI